MKVPKEYLNSYIFSFQKYSTKKRGSISIPNLNHPNGSVFVKLHDPFPSRSTIRRQKEKENKKEKQQQLTLHLITENSCKSSLEFPIQSNNREAVKPSLCRPTEWENPKNSSLSQNLPTKRKWA